MVQRIRALGRKKRRRYWKREASKPSTNPATGKKAMERARAFSSAGTRRPTGRMVRNEIATRRSFIP
jgi:hypothetical protein